MTARDWADDDAATVVALALAHREEACSAIAARLREAKRAGIVEGVKLCAATTAQIFAEWTKSPETGPKT